jgi:hypothetical protein
MEIELAEASAKLVEQQAEIERLRAALEWFVGEYDKVQPMRQARMHNPGCRCVLCAYDNARATLEGK